MKTFTIYTSQIEDVNYTDGAESWPVGTAKKLKSLLEKRFPDLTVDIVDNVVGGFSCSGCTDIESDTIKAVATDILLEL